MFDSESSSTTDSVAPPRHTPPIDPQIQAILALTADGLSLKQVAYELGLSTTAACRLRQEALRSVGFDNVCHFVAARARAATHGPRSSRSARPHLTPAEREIVRLVADGWTNSAIARARGRSERTIANQLARLFRKLQVQSRIELAIRVARYEEQ